MLVAGLVDQLLVVPQRHGLGRLGERPGLVLELHRIHRRLVQRGQTDRIRHVIERLDQFGLRQLADPVLGPDQQVRAAAGRGFRRELVLQLVERHGQRVDGHARIRVLERGDDFGQLVRLGAGPAVPEENFAFAAGCEPVVRRPWWAQGPSWEPAPESARRGGRRSRGQRSLARPGPEGLQRRHRPSQGR